MRVSVKIRLCIAVHALGINALARAHARRVGPFTGIPGVVCPWIGSRPIPGCVDVRAPRLQVLPARCAVFTGDTSLKPLAPVLK